VAERAGVGIATVSRVINRSPLVTTQKTEKVLQAIQEVGYKIPAMGRRPGKRKKSAPELTHGAVCMLMIGRWRLTSAPVYAYVLEGVESALRLKNVNCIVRNVYDVSDLDSLKGMQVDGFIVLGAGGLSDWPLHLQSYPSVSVLGLPGSGWGDCVTYNNASTGKLAAHYLLLRGVKHAAIMGFGGDDELFDARRDGLRRTMAASGAIVTDLSSEHMPEVGSPNDEAVAACFKAFLRLSPRPDGIFITSDVVVPAVYRELNRHRLIPGKNIHLVSCNNERSYLADLKTPPAEVDIQSGLIGKEAVEALFWRLQNPNAAQRSILIEPLLHLPSPPAA